MRDSFQFWHTHAITYNASNNKSPVSARNKRHNRCNQDIVLAALPCATQLGKLIFEHSLDKCRRGGDAASQPTRRQTQTHNSATDKSLQRTTRKEQQQPQGGQRRQQQQVGDSKKKKRALRRTPSQTQARKMNRRSYGATTIPTATLPTTTAAVAAAFAPVAALWRTATTATTTAQLSGAAPTAPTSTSWLQERRQLGALGSNGTTAGDADDLNLPASGNFSYFAPAISHVILAPTTAPSATTSLMTSLSASDLQPAVIAHNVTASEAAAGGGSGVSAAAGGAGATGAAGDSLNSFYFYETEQFAVLWILFTVIVLGNSAVLFVMFINKNRKSRMNYFIKQLAIADLSVGLLHVLTDIVWRMTISWRAGNVACKVIRFSQVCVTYSSTYVLVAMSIDRYDAITHPMNFSKSWKRARHLVAAAWITSALFSLPILVLYEEKLIQGQMQCWIELGSPWAWQVYMCLVSASLFAFPALIISACYAIIVKTIWAKGSIFVPVERAGYGNAATRRASSRGIIPRAKVKTVKMTFVIVIVFILCWSPYIVFDLLQVFGQIPQTQTNIAIATFIQSLAPLNSAANPLIYCLFSSQVFRTLSRFPPFKWFSCCCRSYRNNSTQNRCNTVGRRLHHSCDSMRTLTTSLTVSRRSNKTAARVVICEHPKNALTMSEV